MLYCQLIKDGDNQKWQQIGRVSHLLHGLLTPGVGLVIPGSGNAWCQLEIVVQFGDAQVESQKSLRSKIPFCGEIVKGLQLHGSSKYQDICISLANTKKNTLRCIAVENLEFNFGLDNWFRGFHASFAFNPVVQGNPFGLGKDAEIVQWTPTLTEATLNKETAKHGATVLFLKSAKSEFLHDLYIHEREESPRTIIRHEKQSTQLNSLLKWVVADGHNAIQEAGGKGTDLELHYSHPQDPSNATARDATSKKRDSMAFNFKCGGKDNQVARLHFTEASGIFKRISLPPLAVFRNPLAPIVTDSNYWANNLNEILEAEPDPRGGDDVPHETITLVLH